MGNQVTPIDPSAYNSSVSEIRRLMQEADEAISTANVHVVPLYWDVGDHIVSVIGDEPKHGEMGPLFKKLLSDIGPKYNERKLYMARRIRECFDREQVEDYAKHKVTLAHFAELCGIEDPKARENYAAKIQEGGLTAAQVHDMVNAAVTENPALATPASQKRRKQQATMNTANKTNPAKAFPAIAKVMEKLLDAASEFELAADRVDALDPETRVKVDESIEHLLELAQNAEPTCRAIRETLSKLLEKASSKNKGKKKDE